MVTRGLVSKLNGISVYARVPFVVRSLNTLSSTLRKGFCDFAAAACIFGTFTVADRSVRSLSPNSVYSFVRLHRSSCRLSLRDGSASVLDPSSRNYAMPGRRLYLQQPLFRGAQSTYPVDKSLPVCLSRHQAANGSSFDNASERRSRCSPSTRSKYFRFAARDLGNLRGPISSPEK